MELSGPADGVTEVQGPAGPGNRRDLWVSLGLALLASVAFYFSVNATQADFDYTSRIASALLHGRLGLQEKPLSWLNEMVPFDGKLLFRLSARSGSKHGPVQFAAASWLD